MANAAMAAQILQAILVRGALTWEKSVVLGFQETGRNRPVRVIAAA